jgi:SAM-dependent methyltransferase
VVAVELGAALAAVARRNLARFPAVEVVTAAFEDWPLPKEPFDLVLAATAFHWIDPDVRVVKAADALRPGGVLATVTTHHIAGGDESFFAQAQACYERWDPETPRGGVPLRPATDVPSSSDELDRSHRFGPARFRRYEWDQPYTTAGYIEVLLTYSGHRALDPAAQTELLDCIARLIDTGYGGQVTKRYLTELRVASTIAR